MAGHVVKIESLCWEFGQYICYDVSCGPALHVVDVCGVCQALLADVVARMCVCSGHVCRYVLFGCLKYCVVMKLCNLCFDI